jgi:hypothetical protein
LKALERGLNDANRALVLSFLGLNPYKQLAFTMRSPSVVFAMSGDYHVQMWPNYTPSEDLYRLGHEVLTEYLQKAKSALANQFVTGSSVPE